MVHTLDDSKQFIIFMFCSSVYDIARHCIKHVVATMGIQAIVPHHTRCRPGDGLMMCVEAKRSERSQCSKPLVNWNVVGTTTIITVVNVANTRGALVILNTNSC